MPIDFPKPLIVITDPWPMPSEAFAASWIARHSRVTPAVVGVVRELSGLGSRREASR